jgi:hypothetical protein
MPISTNNFDRFRRAVHAEQKRRLSRAAIVVQRQAKENLSISGTGVLGPAGGVVRAVKRTKRTIYGAFPSAFGESPHKQTGALRRSVAWELIQGVRMLARVGTNIRSNGFPYGWYHETHGRPWLVKALDQQWSMVRSILTAPWKWTG